MNRETENITKNRVKKLTDFGSNSKKKYLSSLIGKELPAIVEKRRNPDLRVVTNNFIHVKITNSSDFAKKDLGGKRITVKITELCNNFSQTEATKISNFFPGNSFSKIVCYNECIDFEQYQNTFGGKYEKFNKI